MTRWSHSSTSLIYTTRLATSGPTYDDNAIAHFIDTFCHDFIYVTNDTYSCGPAKVEALQRGDINGWYLELRFDSRIDTVLKIILSWFKAHYHVTKYERAQEESPRPKKEEKQLEENLAPLSPLFIDVPRSWSSCAVPSVTALTSLYSLEPIRRAR